MHNSCEVLLVRGASLERSVLETKKLYKVSLSVVLISWALLFILSSFISKGNCSEDVKGTVIEGLTIDEVKHVEVSTSANLVVVEDDESEACQKNMGIEICGKVNTKTEPPDNEQNKDSKTYMRNEEVAIKSSDPDAKEENAIPPKSDNQGVSVPRSTEKEDVLETASSAEININENTPPSNEKLNEDATRSVEVNQVLEERTGPDVDSEEKALPEDDISSGASSFLTEKQQLLEDTSHSEEKMEKSFPKSDNLSSSSHTYVDSEQVSKENSDSGVTTAEKIPFSKDDKLSHTVPGIVEKQQVLEKAAYSDVREEKGHSSDNVSSHLEKEHTLEQPIDSKSEKTVPKNDKLSSNIPRTVEKEQVLAEHPDSGYKFEKRCPPKNEKSRVAPSLGEFKSKTLTAKERYGIGLLGSVKNRVEPGGKEYNYASSSKGAKVLGFNKETNGASNILGKDKDKYLRNPCSAEAKYVIFELSEETLVHTIEIGNFEHYSSNLKDFELLSSLIYPTDSWMKIANFTATNVKHKQRFEVPEPKWARYLKLNLLSHYGSEFYCTLSVLEVYGVDAVETMLEDLISDQDNHFGPEETKPAQPSLFEANEDDFYAKLLPEYYGSVKETTTNTQHEVPKKNGVDLALGADTRPPQIGRMPGDTVLKILMQKVRSLDVNTAILERYLEDLNRRYGKVFKDIDNDIDDKNLVLEQIRSELQTLRNSQNAIRMDIINLFSWRYVASLQLEGLVDQNAALRQEFERVRENQVDFENRTLVIILISFSFGCLAIFKLLADLLTCTCNIRMSENLSRSSSGWFLLLLSSTLITFIIAL